MDLNAFTIIVLLLLLFGNGLFFLFKKLENKKDDFWFDKDMDDYFKF